MGYDFHAARREDWSDVDGPAVSADEWLHIVNTDPELTLDPQNGDYFALFGEVAWFDWSDGQVFTKNPDHNTLDKMLQIAKKLGAKVQGDDGELYDSASQLEMRHVDRYSNEAWIEFLRGSIVPIAVLVLLSMVVFAVCYLLFLRD